MCFPRTVTCASTNKIVQTGKIDYPDDKEEAAQMTRDDNVLLNDVYFTSYNMNHQPLTPLTPISKIVSVPCVLSSVIGVIA